MFTMETACDNLPMSEVYLKCVLTIGSRTATKISHVMRKLRENNGPLHIQILASWIRDGEVAQIDEDFGSIFLSISFVVAGPTPLLWMVKCGV